MSNSATDILNGLTEIQPEKKFSKHQDFMRRILELDADYSKAAMWGRRVKQLLATPGGEEFLEECLQTIEDSQNPILRETKGLSKIDEPIALLNWYTAKFLRDSKGGK